MRVDQYERIYQRIDKMRKTILMRPLGWYEVLLELADLAKLLAAGHTEAELEELFGDD